MNNSNENISENKKSTESEKGMENSDIREYKYLDLLEDKKKRLDQYQYEVCIEDKNVVVAAGAGSGKTQVLATRFAWLVMSKNIPCGKILTLTFTNKAAGEMYERIYQTLKFFAENPKTPDQEKGRAKQALVDFSEVHIQTLDSYCSSIVRQVSNEYGIRPDFVTGASDDDLKNLALPFVFEHRNEPGIQFFAKPGKLQEFANDIIVKAVSEYTSLATEKNHFVKKLPVQVAEICEIWNRIVAGQEKNNFKENDSSENKINVKLNPKIEEICNKSFFEFIHDIQALYDDLPEDNKNSAYGKCTENALTVADDFEKFLGENHFTQDRLIIKSQEDFNRPEIKDCTAKIAEIIKAFDFPQNLKGYTNEVRGEIKKLKNDPDVANLGFYLTSVLSYISQFEYVENLFTLLDEFTQKVNESKRHSGNLSFSDITELSLKILIENKELRKQEKNAYSRIMIDEFQDNNGKNRDLLFLLSEKDFEGEEYGCKTGIPTVHDIKENKLFFVGDEKQSIYKFRGADVQVFNQLKEDFGNTLQMNNNYRSSAELLSAFNKLFGNATAIFNNSTTENFEAKYLPENFAHKYNPAEKIEIELPKITAENSKMHAFMYDKNINESEKDNFLSEKDQIAYFIAKKIHEIYEKHDSDKNISFSDFAILDRSRTNRPYIIKWLNHFGIPYNLDQNSNLFSDGPINDIYNLCRICVYESDLNAMAAYLTSPFANLNQQSVETILCFENKEDDDLKSALSEEQFEKYQSAMNRYKEIKQMILSQRLTKTLTILWQDYGYCYETMVDKKVSLYAEQYDMLFELARQTDENGKSPAWFVDQLAQMKNNENSSFQNDVEIDVKEIKYPLEKESAVQIMTIHKSKGLQFDYVFVCGCTGAKAKSDTSKLFYEENSGLSIAPDEGVRNYFAAIQKEHSQKKDLAEFRRIIYVALTRACKEIFIVGSYSAKKSNSSKSSDSKTDFKLFENYFETLKKDDSDFALDYNEISPVEKSVLWEDATDALKSKSDEINSEKNENKTERFERLKTIYQNAKILEPEKIEDFRKKPSELELQNAHDFSFDRPQISELTKLDEIFQKYNPQKSKNDENSSFPDQASEKNIMNNTDASESKNFDEKAFGTLAHKYLEDFISLKFKEDFSESDYTGGVKLYKNLSDEDKKEISECALSMCRNFRNSQLGKEVCSAISENRTVKTEWAFRMYQDKILYTGSLDLIFQNPDGTYTLVDYKTDRKKCNEKYIPQQKCYRTAAANLLGIPEEKITSKLFYLRYGVEEKLDF